MKLCVMREKYYKKARDRKAPSESLVRLYKSLQRLCIRVYPEDGTSPQRESPSLYNEYEVFWYTAAILVLSGQLSKHLLTDFIVDIESKFCYYCDSFDHSEFSIMQAFKVISILHNQDKRARI